MLQRLVKRIKEKFFNDTYLIMYHVINYQAVILNGTEKKISEWESPIYVYAVNSDSEKHAREEFISKWSRRVDSFEPEPTLKILSVDKIDNLSNKIHIK